MPQSSGQGMLTASENDGIVKEGNAGSPGMVKPNVNVGMLQKDTATSCDQ